MTEPTRTLDRSLEDELKGPDDLDHIFCIDCYPDLNPPASMCGWPDDGVVCFGDCTHPECSVCREIFNRHTCK